MQNLAIRFKTKQQTERGIFRNEDGAIDLASIMVGIIVIGLIGGVTAATVFAVIPWTQDNAAKQQLDSVAAAESAYFGLSAAVPSQLPAGSPVNSFGTSAQLQAAGLLKSGDSYCVTTPAGGKSWQSFSQSSSGAVWSSTDKNTKPVIFTGTLPTDCQFVTEAAGGTGDGTAVGPNPSETPAPVETTPPYVDPTPNLTVMTFRCNANTNGTIPLKGALTGTETWDDGFAPRTYTNAATASQRAFVAGVTYKMTFDGTYNAMNMGTNIADPIAACLRSVDHWGSETGVTNTYRAFLNTPNFTDVPENIPTTITSMYGMFHGATVMNDPDVGKWDVSNVTDMTQMFVVARAFNQPLDQWDTSNVTTMYGMFENAWAFNQPLESWDVSKVTTMKYMFHIATGFNQPLGNWNTASLTDITFMFQGATKFNGDLNGWDTSKITSMLSVFEGATVFNKSLNDWNMSNVTTLENMFYGAQWFNQPLDNWDVSKVQNMQMLFFGANAFNQNINNWNTVSATNILRTFASARSFNQPLNDWNTSNVTNMAQTFHDAKVFNQPLDQWDTSKVTSMQQTFRLATVFNQNISGWQVDAVTNYTEFSYSSALTAENRPLF